MMEQKHGFNESSPPVLDRDFIVDYTLDQDQYFHSFDDKPAVVYRDGVKEWYKHGELHRDYGPSIIHDSTGLEEYVLNGEYHRLDGPARIHGHDRTIGDWWINGRPVTAEIHRWADEYNIDLENLTEDDVTMIAMNWIKI